MTNGLFEPRSVYLRGSVAIFLWPKLFLIIPSRMQNIWFQPDFNFLLSYATGCNPCPKFCSEIAPTDTKLASVVTTKGKSKFGIRNTGATTRLVFQFIECFFLFLLSPLPCTTLSLCQITVKGLAFKLKLFDKLTIKPGQP